MGLFYVLSYLLTNLTCCLCIFCPRQSGEVLVIAGSAVGGRTDGSATHAQCLNPSAYFDSNCFHGVSHFESQLYCVSYFDSNNFAVSDFFSNYSSGGV